MITKPEQHQIDRAGKRLLREVLEPLGWVVNDVQEDYGIDCNIQVFDGQSPTGAWFHVQLKSSASSDYSKDRTFISQELSIDHARHYGHQMREPVLVMHADVTAQKLYWYAPQLDQRILKMDHSEAVSITVRIPTDQELPVTAPFLLTALEKIYLALASRELASASMHAFTETVKYMPDQEGFQRAIQKKADMLKLQRVRELFRQRKMSDAQPRAQAVLSDPDSSLEAKFWAEIQLEAIDYFETLNAGKAQSELPKVLLRHSKALQTLTSSWLLGSTLSAGANR